MQARRAELIPLKPLQQTSSMLVITEARIEPVDDGRGLTIRLQAMPPGHFAPSALHDQITLLIVRDEQGIDKVVSGRIQIIPSEEPRGVWFDYRFVPAFPEDLRVTFEGECQWSNVVSVVLIIGGRARGFPNPFDVKNRP